MKIHQGLLFAFLLFVMGAQTPARAQQLYPLDMPAQPLSNALTALASQTGIQVAFFSEVTEGKQAPALVGDYSVEKALDLLLVDTDLVHQRLDENGSITIRRKGTGGDGASAGSDSAEVLAFQEASGEIAAESVTSAKRGGIEEIIVTARRREESVQDIPISMTALTAEDIKTLGIRNIADMEGIVPGLNMGGGGNGVKKDSNPFIRGVGQRETKVTLDPAVGTYIDGIYLGRPAGGLIDVATVDSIEVLRGPQGTLFGRNATGGAISITTKKPTRGFSGEISTNVGNYGRHDAVLAVNVPLIDDTLLSRLTVSSVNSAGYFTNDVDNTMWGGDNRITGIGQLRWLPLESLTVDILAERTRIRETPRPQRCAFIKAPGFKGAQILQIDGATNRNRGGAGQPPLLPTFEEQCRASAALSPDRFFSDMAVGNDILEPARYFVDTATLGGTVNWQLGDIGALSDVALKSISAWRRVEQIADEDLDAVGSPYLLRVQPHGTKTSQLSQELQVSAKTFDDRIFFSSGLYYFGEKTPSDVLNLSAGAASATAPDVNGNYYHALFEPTQEKLTTNNKAYAWFGQLDFDLTPQIQATAGVRYTDEKHQSGYSRSLVIPGSAIRGSPPITCALLPALGVCNPTTSAPGFYPQADWQFAQTVAAEGTHRDKIWTPMASLKYKAGESLLDAIKLNHALAYLTYSEGFHAGGITSGINAQQNEVIEFRPETVQNYEAGLKLAALERRLQANLAVFYMDYTDMQVTSTGDRFGVPVPYVENVGKAVIQGIELDLVAQPTPEWRVLLSGGFTDADFKRWDGNTGKKSRFNSTTPAVPVFLDRSDEPMPRVPRWQAFLMTDYMFAFAGGSTLTPSIAMRYTSEIYHGFDRGSYVYTYGGYYWGDGGNDPTKSLPGVWNTSDPFIAPPAGSEKALTAEPTAFLDARVAWISADARMQIDLWAKNLTNEDDYLVGGIPLVDVTGAAGLIYANPRTFGLNLSYTFGAM